MVLESANATVRRPGSTLAVRLPTGELLYPGDELNTGAASLTIQFCGTGERLRLSPSATITITAGEVRIRAGSIEDRTRLSTCILPDLPLDRAPRFYGATLSRGEPGPPAPGLTPERSRQLEAELAPVKEILVRDPNNAAALASQAAILERYSRFEEAASAYERVQAAWTNVDWPRKLVHQVREKERRRGEAAAESSEQGKTYALVVGISKYPKLQPNEQLRFAHRDAVTFSEYLRSERGGALPADQVRVLMNEQATTAATRNGIATFLRAKARKQDTVILFLATHGVVDEQKTGYILTHDSDPEDLKSTAIPMAELQSLLDEELAHVGKAMIYVDACRAGTIGAIKRGTDIHRVVEVLMRNEGHELLGILASGPGEVSYESDRFGGGHGAFSYFLLRGLNGDADEDSDGIVDSGELVKYVRDKVREATLRAQNPREMGTMPNDAPLVRDTKAPGIVLAGWRPLDPEMARRRARTREAVIPAPGVAMSPSAFSGAGAALESAIAENRILPGQGGAFELLAQLRGSLSPAQRLDLENRLRVALQNRGQETILRYLQGDATPQRREDFQEGEQYFRASLALDPGAFALESRALFCQGRALLFDKRYDESIRILEQAARMDPQSAYHWNALGIAYLEKADYSRAAQAFQDAIHRAPYWAYPRHNLALTLSEQGNAAAARDAYKQAIGVVPVAAYLHYNYGLLLERTNQRKAAETQLKRAIELAPTNADNHNALGFVYASRGKRRQAEAQYREAIQRDARSPLARHNLALLLSRDRKLQAEAISLWEENLRVAPDFLASRQSLASALSASDRMDDAVAQWLEVLKRQPESLSARLELARLYEKMGKLDSSAEQLRYLIAKQPSSTLWKQLGGVLRNAGQVDDANRAFEEARRARK